MGSSRAHEQTEKRRRLAAALLEIEEGCAIALNERQWLLQVLDELGRGLEPGGSPEAALRELGRLPRRRAAPAASDLPAPRGGGFRTLDPQEIEALVDYAFDPDVDRSIIEDRGGRRRLFALAVDFVVAGDALPVRLRAWFVEAMRALLDALGPGSAGGAFRLTSALNDLGLAPRGRPAQERDEVGIAAAVSVLARYGGKTAAVELAARALALSDDEVWRICSATTLAPAAHAVCGAVFGPSADLPDDLDHAHALGLGQATLRSVGSQLAREGAGGWPVELLDLLRVTQAG